MQDSIAVANYFIKKGLDTKTEVPPMKLQKLIYFAHGWHLALHGEPLIDDTVQAWKYGPVVPSVYHCFKSYGNDAIKELQGDTLGRPPKIVTDAEAVEILDLVWDMYSKLDSLQLSTMTHEADSPWSQTVQPYQTSGKLPRHKEIPTDLIKSYFEKKLEN